MFVLKSKYDELEAYFEIEQMKYASMVKDRDRRAASIQRLEIELQEAWDANGKLTAQVRSYRAAVQLFGKAIVAAKRSLTLRQKSIEADATLLGEQVKRLENVERAATDALEGC